MTDVLGATPAGIDRAAELLRDGRIVAFPTDTVYGVAVIGESGLPALFALKGRPADRRIPMLVAGLADATDAGWVADARAHDLADRFWPGALTIVLARSDGAATQAFRAPDHAVALDLIRATGPIYATSANRSDEPDTLGADEVLIAFAVQQDELAAVLDGGPVSGGVASTVIDVSVTPARILRDGPVTRDALAEVIELAG
jgi:L-threonylcarbamoyladenylate synthase